MVVHNGRITNMINTVNSIMVLFNTNRTRSSLCTLPNLPRCSRKTITQITHLKPTSRKHHNSMVHNSHHSSSRIPSKLLPMVTVGLLPSKLDLHSSGKDLLNMRDPRSIIILAVVVALQVAVEVMKHL